LDELTYFQKHLINASCIFEYKLEKTEFKTIKQAIMSIKETFTVTGENLLKRIKELISEGNVTKISISDKSGKEIMSFPITLGVIGVVLAPIFAAVGAIAALLTECKITVERTAKPEEGNDSDIPTSQPTSEQSDIEIH